MSYFKQAVQMMSIDHQVYGSGTVDYLTDKLTSEEVELECEKAAKTISLEQGNEVIAMNDLFMIVHGDEDDINSLKKLYPVTNEKLDELWNLIDSDYIDNLELK